MVNDAAVSICIPTYNGEKYLTQALESAVSQTYPHTEILIVDDGSADNTVVLAKEFATRQSNIKVIQHNGKNMVANWMKCIELAQHNWVKFLFQDDVLEKECVKKMMQLCDDTNTPIALCARSFIISDDILRSNEDYFKGIPKPEQIFPPGLIQPSQIAKQVVKHGMQNIFGEPVCLLFNKTILQETGSFNSEFLQLMDLEFIIRYGLKYGIAFTSEVLAHFRIHPAAQTLQNTPEKNSDAAIQKNIRSVYGDEIVLLKMFLWDNRFQEIKNLWGEKELHTAIKYFYLKACKKYGKQNVQAALENIFSTMPEMMNLHFSGFEYLKTKFQYNISLSRREKL